MHGHTDTKVILYSLQYYALHQGTDNYVIVTGGERAQCSAGADIQTAEHSVQSAYERHRMSSSCTPGQSDIS